MPNTHIYHSLLTRDEATPPPIKKSVDLVFNKINSLPPVAKQKIEPLVEQILFKLLQKLRSDKYKSKPPADSDNITQYEVMYLLDNTDLLQKNKDKVWQGIVNEMAKRKTPRERKNYAIYAIEKSANMGYDFKKQINKLV